MEKKNLIGQIHNAMYQNIQKKGWVAPVDVFMEMDILTKQDYEKWRFGKILVLEYVCNVNLRKLSDIMREVRAYAAKNKLKSSWTCYHGRGKNKDIILQFSKSGNEKIEYNYATHYVDSKRITELKQ